MAENDRPSEEEYNRARDLAAKLIRDVRDDIVAASRRRETIDVQTHAREPIARLRELIAGELGYSEVVLYAVTTDMLSVQLAGNLWLAVNQQRSPN